MSFDEGYWRREQERAAQEVRVRAQLRAEYGDAYKDLKDPCEECEEMTHIDDLVDGVCDDCLEPCDNCETPAHPFHWGGLCADCYVDS